MIPRDEYRVNLLKKKIKISIPGDRNIRLYNSHDKSHLVIPLFLPYYGKEVEVCEIITKHLRKNRIEYVVNKSPFRFDFGNSDKPWSIGIPIDQAALPERKRSKK